MKAKSIFSVLFVVFALLFSACPTPEQEVESNGQPPTTTPDVYVAGGEEIGGRYVATLWKNGKQQTSLERYVLYMRLGKKYYAHLKSEYRDKKLSKEKIVSILMQSKHSRELSESIVEKWDKEK